MNSNEEVNPTQSGEDEVFSDTEASQGDRPQAIESLREVPASAVLVKCQTCQKDFARKGPNSKFCDACAPGRNTITRKKRADKTKVASYVYDSGVEPTKVE